MKTSIKKRLLYIFLLVFIFVVYRLPLLGFDFLNTDAPRWKRRTYVFSSAIFSGDFEKTAVIYHPGVIIMWLGTFSVKIYNLFSEIVTGTVDISTPSGFMWLHFTQKISIVLFLAVSLLFSLYLLHKSFKNTFVLIFFTIFTFEPMVLAYTRVLHTDALVTFMSFISVLAVYHAFSFKRSFIKLPLVKFKMASASLWYLVGGVYCGMALLTKSNSLFLIPFIGLELLVLYIYQYKKEFFNVKTIFNLFKDYFIWLLIALITFIVLWPAMWVEPLETIQYYFSGIVGIGVEGGHTHKWFGVLTRDPGPLFYPVILFIRYTPWLVLFSFAGIVTYFYGYFRSKKSSSLFLVSFLFIFVYYIFMSVPTKKLDRYLLPAIPFFSLFASYYLINLLMLFKKGKNRTMLVFISVILVFTLNFVSTYKFFPNYLAYYSPLAGGFTGATEIINHKWPLGHRELYTFVSDLPNASERSTFIRKPFLYDPFLEGDAHDLVDVEISEPGDLFILKGNDDWEFLKGKKHSQIDVLNMGNIQYFWVFEFIE